MHGKKENNNRRRLVMVQQNSGLVWSTQETEEKAVGPIFLLLVSRGEEEEGPGNEKITIAILRSQRIALLLHILAYVALNGHEVQIVDPRTNAC